MAQSFGRERPANDEISDALARVLNSSVFSRSERSRELLQYIVEQELAGDGARLKGFSIAQDVFGKDAGFDPQTDAVVRVQAGRLRENIAAYYDDEGRNDPVRILVPRGTYVPAYEIIETSEILDVELSETSAVDVDDDVEITTPQSVKVEPSVPVSKFVVSNIRAIWLTLFVIIALLGAILFSVWTQPEPAGVDDTNILPRALNQFLPPNSLPTIEFVLNSEPDDGAGEFLLRRLVNAASRFHTVRIVNQQRGNPDVARVSPDFVVRLALLEDGTGDVDISHRASGETVWNAHVTNDPAKRTKFNYSVPAALSGTLLPSGSIYTFLAGRNELSGLAKCLWETNSFYLLQNEAQFISAFKCHEAIVGQENPSALAYADLASLYVERITDGYPYPESANADDALAMARSAIETATLPESYRALGIALSLTNDTIGREEAYQKAYSLNPFDLEIAASYGWSLLKSQAFQDASIVLSDVLDNSFTERTWWSYALFISAYYSEKYDVAARAAGKLAGSPRSHYIAARLIIANRNGNEPLRLELLETLGKSTALVARDPAAYYTKLYGEQASMKFVDALRSAGFDPARTN